MAERPNFLFIMTDQHCFDQLACHGNSVVKTPNIDRLFENGTSVNGMYTATPICMPNRQAFLTMRMGSVNGGHSNGTPLDMDNNTFPELLRAAGYRTALIGKSHLQNMIDVPSNLQPAPAPSDKQPPPLQLANASKTAQKFHESSHNQERSSAWHADSELTTPYYGFDEVILASRHFEVAGYHHKQHLDAIDPSLVERTGRSNSLNASTLNPQLFESTLAPEHYPTRFVGNQTKSWLQNHAATNKAQPFFVWCSFPDPHHPWTPPAGYYDMYDPADVILPDSFYDSPRNQTPPLRWALAHEQNKTRNPRMPFMADEEEARHIVATTYGMITFIDELIGEIVDTLSETGLAENTVVVFTTDHGDYMGHHGLFLKGACHYQSLIKVPFIWHDPHSGLNRGSVDALASYVDIGRTILDRANLWPYHGAQGTSLLPLFKQQSDSHRHQVLVEHTIFSPKFGFPYWAQVRTIVTETHRLTIYSHTDEGELYDLVADPGEIINLWRSATEIKADLLLRLAQEMASMADQARTPVTLA